MLASVEGHLRTPFDGAVNTGDLADGLCGRGRQDSWIPDPSQLLSLDGRTGGDYQ